MTPAGPWGFRGAACSRHLHAGRYFYRALLHELEESTAKGKRAVLYGVSPENHQPLTRAEKFGNTCQTTMRRLAQLKTDVLRAAVEEDHAGPMRPGGRQTRCGRWKRPPSCSLAIHRPNLTLPDGETICHKAGLCPGT